MAKYINKKKKQKRGAGRIILLVALAVLVAAVIWVVGILKEEQIPVLELNSTPTQGADVSAEQEAEIQWEQEATEPQVVELEEGLQILYIGKYAGMYMEDGTNEPVANVMMTILENTDNADLQLARISVVYSGFTAEFEVTNLPAGEKVVLLEKNRHEATAEDYQSIHVSNMVYFPETMNLQEDRLKITGGDGVLTVENISGEDISGDIYIYYKHSAEDLLYGGITYRVAVRGGLKAGGNSTVIAGHYTPDTCRLLSADIGA